MFLAEIRDTASKFAETISQILDVDVMIIDRSYTRVANTFRYVNDPPPVRAESITGRVIATGKVMVVSDKHKSEECKGCTDQDDCCIAQIIAVPILYESKTVGAIDLLVPFGKSSAVFDNLELSIDFLERMADLLSSKLRNIDDYNKLDVIKKEREILLDFIEDALVYTDEMGEIIHWNNQFARLFDLDSSDVGRRLDKIIDHPLVRGAIMTPRSFSNQEFNYSALNVSFSGFMSCRHIQRNGVKYGVMFIFRSIDKAYGVLNEISHARAPVSFETLRTNDQAMAALLDSAKKIAVTNETVLVTGAGGTGKSILVRAIHDFSDRAAKPFLVVNCRGFSLEYLGDEIFGRDTEDEDELASISTLRMAQDGTVFFRHIEELPLLLQKRLTRVIKAKKLGAENKVAARMIFSSDVPVSGLVTARLFDEELAVRISRYSMAIPALADRPVDIRLMVDLYADKYTRLYGRRRGLEQAARESLYLRSWPGNVRQIERTMEYLLSDPSVEAMSHLEIESRVSRLAGSELRSEESLEEMEKKLILKVMAFHKNKDEAARALQISRATLYRKLKQYDLS